MCIRPHVTRHRIPGRNRKPGTGNQPSWPWPEAISCTAMIDIICGSWLRAWLGDHLCHHLHAYWVGEEIKRKRDALICFYGLMPFFSKPHALAEFGAPATQGTAFRAGRAYPAGCKTIIYICILAFLIGKGTGECFSSGRCTLLWVGFHYRVACCSAFIKAANFQGGWLRRAMGYAAGKQYDGCQ
jgi:hypothetical protein